MTLNKDGTPVSPQRYDGMVSKEEFEEWYAKKSGRPAGELRALNLVVVPCDCDYAKCEGWRMTHAAQER